MHPFALGSRLHMGAGLQCPPGPRAACTPLPTIYACAIRDENPSRNPGNWGNRLERRGLHISLSLLFTRGEEILVLTWRHPRWKNQFSLRGLPG